MAKAAAKTKPGTKLKAKPTPEGADYDDKYLIESGLRTLTKAEELRGDKTMMDKIAAHAAEQAEVASRAKMMVARGLISDKQQAKLTGKVTPDINKAPADANEVNDTKGA